MLGVWLGAATFADIAVTQNFQTIDRFLADPGSSAAAADLKSIGASRARALLRRNAAEENNFLFLNFERAEIAMGVALLFFLGLQRNPSRFSLALAGSMLLIVIAQHFYLSPRVAGMGRYVDGMPAADPFVRRFWILHGVYSGLEIGKLLVGAGLAIRLCFRGQGRVRAR